MVTIIAREGVLSMTDLFSYLLPYPAVSLFCDSKITISHQSTFQAYCNSSVGRFWKVIPRYQTEGVSIQSHLQLNVA
jgi:hypothetical protein